MKLIVSPGLARSGTTYVFHELMRRAGSHFNQPITKEINYFANPNGAVEFSSLFKSNNPDKYYIDFSPAYSSLGNSVIDRILSFECSIKKIILFLRSPVDQIFSYYLHDIIAHIAKGERGERMSLPLFSDAAFFRYFFLRKDQIKRLVDTVGMENILVINFHSDIQDPNKLSSKLSDFLNIKIHHFDRNHNTKGGWLPYFVYGGDDGTIVPVGDEVFLLPKNSLLLANGQHSRLWKDVEPERVAQLQADAATWTHTVTSEQYRAIYDAVRADWEATLDLLNQEASAYPTTGHLSAARPEIPRKLLMDHGVRAIPLSEHLEFAFFPPG